MQGRQTKDHEQVECELQIYIQPVNCSRQINWEAFNDLESGY